MADDIQGSGTEPEQDINSQENSSNQTNLSPQQIASNAFQKDSTPPDLSKIDSDKMKKPKKKKFSLKDLTKKQKIIIAIVAAVVLIAGGFALWWFVLRSKPQPAEVQQTKQEAPQPTTVQSKLTGLQVDPAVNQRVVTGIMIENSPDARPQSGLKDAGVVFEAIAEGGITRFLAIYQDSQPDYIGPVRSARPYYVRWVLPFNAGYAHVGGSPQALSDIKTLGVRDLDQFANSGAYERVSNRYAPHNVYTSIAKLNSLEAEKGWTTSDFTWVDHKEKAEGPASQEGVTAGTINLNISSALYNVTYAYDLNSGKYLRNMGGQPHIDEKANAQITPDVVVALVMDKSLDPDGHHTVYGTTGSGTMYLFQDGGVQQGTWKKDSDSAQLQFIDSGGNPFKLNPGQTWISVVSSPDQVTYSP